MGSRMALAWMALGFVGGCAATIATLFIASHLGHRTRELG